MLELMFLRSVHVGEGHIVTEYNFGILRCDVGHEINGPLVGNYRRGLDHWLAERFMLMYSIPYRILR